MSKAEEYNHTTLDTSQIKHKENCLTCRIRKKKCFKEYPICSNCKRLDKNCVWIDESMTVNQIRKLKEQVLNEQTADRLKKKVESQSRRISHVEANKKKKQFVENVGLSINGGTFNVIQLNKVSPSYKVAKPVKKQDVNYTPHLPFNEEYFENVASTFEHNLNEDNTILNNEYLLESLSALDSELKQLQSPQFKLPLTKSIIPLVLSIKEQRYYDYYTNHLSSIVSIVPPELNYYTVLFLPLAAKNSGIMNAILSWSAAHMGDDKESAYYLDKSFQYVELSLIRDVQDSVEKLSNWMILIATQLCLGDISKWNEYMIKAVKVIEDGGGLKKFNKTKEQNWLISNVFYHDTLSSSANETGTLYSTEAYDEFIADEQFGVLDPLTGLVKPLLTIIGEISNLASESRSLFKEAESNDSIDDQDCLLSIVAKVKALETKIENTRPNFKQTHHYSIKELELQFTLFELFQFTAKLHLKHSVLNLCPSSLETQILVNEALKGLEIVLGTPVETILCFPLLIIGINCSKEKDRQLILRRFDEFIYRCHFKQIFRTKTLVEKVWELDPYGNKCIDWYAILKELEWDVCFA